jgi:hypothetical protein
MRKRRLIIERLLETVHGTFGQLHVPTPAGDFYSFFCLEEENKGNRVGESRIPAGVYEIRRSYYFDGGYDTYEVLRVEGRSRILFHVGNVEENTDGCILPGLTMGFLVVDRDEETGRSTKKLAVLQSRKAFRKFMDLMGDDESAILEIRDEGE